MSQFMTEEQLAQEQAQYYDDMGNYQGQGQDGVSTNYPSEYTSGNYTSYGFDGGVNMNQWMYSIMKRIPS